MVPRSGIEPLYQASETCILSIVLPRDSQGFKSSAINKIMNYRKIYDTIIERAKTRTLEGYSENHHIIPRCMGGSDLSENMARLTAREHYIVHLLLVKNYPTESKLVFAFNMMCSLNNRKYEWLKILFSDTQSKSAKLGHQVNSNYGMKGKFHSSETRKMMSISNKKPAKIVQCPKCNISGGENNMLRYHFENCGLKIPLVRCPHCQKEVSANIAKRWHFNRCKFKVS